MFKEVLSKRDKRKLVLGVGVNDADYKTGYKENGKVIKCPYYTKWSGMLSRCYSGKYHKKQRTYASCSVCDEWLYFSNFKKWMERQDWEGKHLDKDILTQGNKVYSPEHCCFVDSKVNSLFIKREYKKGKYPQGVSLHNGTGKYHAKCSNIHLGLFDNLNDAVNAYKTKKKDMIAEAARTQDEPIRSAMLKYEV